MIENLNLGLIYHGFAFFSMFLMSWWAFKTKSIRFISENGWAEKKEILFLLVWGILVWGIFPILFSEKNIAVELVFGKVQPSSFQLFLFFSLSISAILIGYSQAKKLNINHPFFQPSPNLTLFSTYFCIRILFLISYEIWFRGYFLQELIIIFPLTIALAINTFLYALIHIFSGRREALSSIGFGLLLCYMVLSFQAVWPAIIIHLSLSLGYEMGFYLRFSKKKSQQTITE
jgi:membrane protease YdiL (CAAX protease family)